MASAVLSSTSDMTQDLSQTLNPEGKNIIEIIMEEHKLVDSLGARYQSETNQKQRQGIANNIIKLLSIHAACEEAALYPWMRKHLHNGNLLVEHALKEHQTIKEDLYKLDSMNIADPNFTTILMKALKDTKHHVNEEESDLLPKIKSQASAAELDEIRTSFLRSKSLAPSRPHPSAPVNPPANVVANAMAMPMDAAKDAASGRFSGKAGREAVEREKEEI